MKEERVRETQQRTVPKLTNQINTSRSQIQNSTNGSKLRDTLHWRSESTNGFAKETKMRVKTSSLGANTVPKKNDQTSVRATTRGSIVRKVEPAKKCSGIPALEIHHDQHFTNTKQPIAQQNSKAQSGEHLTCLKRSARSINQRVSECNSTKRPDLADVHELGELRKSVRELQEREEKLQNKLLLKHKELEISLHKVSQLEKELDTKCVDIEKLNMKIVALEAGHNANTEQKSDTFKDLELEVIQLRNLSMELEHQNREMGNKLAATESQILALSKATEAKILERPTGISASPHVLTKTGSAELVEKCPEFKDRHKVTLPKIENHRVEMEGENLMDKEATIADRPALIKLMPTEYGNRALRIPKPPPKPTLNNTATIANMPPEGTGCVPPMPPPPPPPPPPSLPPKLSTARKNVMQRAPEVVQFYHSLMKRDAKKDASAAGNIDSPDLANAHSGIIGEIENRSSHLLAIKADVETQGDFVRFLIREVQGAAYTSIEDVVAFVKWLDDELSFLVDERAVLKHFDWPERKADAMREAAFGFRDLKKLESEVGSYEDDLRQPCDIALKRMTTLWEKLEQSVYNMLRTRDMAMACYKEFQIPTDWMLDTGIVSKIKFASVKLAKKYMRRVSIEVESTGCCEKEPIQKFLLLQGVRFAFRAHQFAGGFDAETMHAFEDLRHLAEIHSEESQELQYAGLPVQ